MALFREKGVELKLRLVLNVVDGLGRGLEAEELEESDFAILWLGADVLDRRTRRSERSA
jgi:hypothetical protein